MENKVLVIVLVILAMVILAIGEAKKDHREYCEMVKLWNDSKHLPPEDRPGWPPYKGECQ